METRRATCADIQKLLEGVTLGDPESVGDKLDALFTNANLFGVDLKAAGLDKKVEGFFEELLSGAGAVRKTLEKYL